MPIILSGVIVTLQKSPIRIGSIDLQDFEVPPSVRFGGQHRLVVHTLSGGKRVIERLGPEEGDIIFNGTFSGAKAEGRMRMLDNLRAAGKIVWLTWESFRRQIIVKDLEADYHSPWWIPYRITYAVVDQKLCTVSGVFSLAAVISADLGNALTAASGSTLQLGVLQASLSPPNALVTGSAAHAQASIAVSDMLSSIDLQIARQSNNVATNISAAADLAEQSEAFTTIVSTAGALAASVATRSYVGRMKANLGAERN